MTEKKYKEVVPYGELKTRTGKEYYLLSPHPILKDWEQDRQQRFLVTPKEAVDSVDGDFLYGYARPLITTDPDIEIWYDAVPIKVWDITANEFFNDVEPPEYDDDVLSQMELLEETA